MTDTTHDDLVKRLDQALHFEDWMPVPENFSVAVPLLQESRNRIEELEAKLATAMKFVKDFSYRAKTKEHNEDETWLVGESEIRFQRDCDITQARMIIAELETPHD